MPFKELSLYLPDYWDHVLDIDILYKAVSTQIKPAIKAYEKVKKGQYVQSMSLDRIKEYEKMFHITPASQQVEDRRQQLLSTISRQTPYSLPFLENYLNQILGKYRWYHVLLKNEWRYILYIDFRLRNFKSHVMKMIDSIMPAHILLESIYYMPTHATIGYGMIPVQKTEITYKVNMKGA